MEVLHAIELQVKQRMVNAPASRPFLCRGSPLGCDVATVGINPATDTPFWPYWNTRTGFDKDAWLADYRRRHTRLKPTRDRLEVFHEALAPLRCLELNLYSPASRNEASLAAAYRVTDLFDYLLDVVRPALLLVHGNTPIRHLSLLLQTAIVKDGFVSASYRGHDFEIFAATRHFGYVSRDYAASVANQLRCRLLSQAVPST